MAFILVIGFAMVQLTGCSAWTGLNNNWKYNGYWNESMMGYRTKAGATRAWHARKHHFCNEKYMREFAAGFKAGYAEVAGGGNGCTPAFPPREYWGWKYQSCEGQARVAAWYAGFPHGARAAEEEGVGSWSQIQTSANIQHQYAQNGMLNPNYSGIYPIPQSAVPNGMAPQALAHEVPIIMNQEPVGGYSVSIEDVPSEPTTAPSIIHQ